MNPTIGLFLIVLFLTTVEIVCNRFIKKVTNTYWFWLGISIFVLTWLIVFRFRFEWATYAEAKAAGELDDPTGKIASTIISDAFLMNICPFSSVCMYLSLIFDPSRKVARSIAPMALMGGILTVCFSAAKVEGQWSWEFIFFGEDPNKLFFFLHSIQILVATGVLLNTPCGKWKSVLGSVGALVGFISYIFIVRGTTGCCWACCGFCVNDFTEIGFLHIFSVILHIPPEGCPYVTPFILGGAIAIPILLKELVFTRFKWFHYGNVRNIKTYFWKTKKGEIRIPEFWKWWDYNKNEPYKTLLPKNQIKENEKFSVWLKKWESKNNKKKIEKSEELEIK